MDMNKLLENYGCLTFSDDIMRERIPKSTYKEVNFYVWTIYSSYHS